MQGDAGRGGETETDDLRNDDDDILYGARASRSTTAQVKMDLRILISSESQRIVTISFHFYLFYLRAYQRVSRPGLVTRHPRPRPVAGYSVRLLVRGLVKFRCAVA